MAKYYFIGTYLPPLYFDMIPDISLTEFHRLLHDNLNKRDYEKTQLIRTVFDILNLRSLWLEQPHDPWGNMDENELEEALITQTGLPDFVYDFLEKYEKKEDRLHHFPALLVQFFGYMESRDSKGFLQRYLKYKAKAK